MFRIPLALIILLLSATVRVNPMVAQGSSICVPDVTSSHRDKNGADPEVAFDRNLGTTFESTYNDWQFIQIDFNCVGTLEAIRRWMSYKNTIAGNRGHKTPIQGEGASYSIDGINWVLLTGPTTNGWQDYVNYGASTPTEPALRAWHTLPYGDSGWLNLTTPARARYVRFNWDGDDDAVNEILVRFLPPNVNSLPKECPTFSGEQVWTNYLIDVPQRVIYDVFAGFDKNQVWATGDKGIIMHSRDQGRSWTSLYDPSNAQLPGVTLFSLTVTPQRHVWAAGFSTNSRKLIEGTVVHYDGQRGQLLFTGSPDILGGITVASDRYVWAVGGNRTIVHTSDGGQTWARQNAPTSIPATTTFYDVAAVSKNEVWVVGDGGVILQTTDGGQNWRTHLGGSSDPHGALRAIGIDDSSTVWIVGEGGTLLRFDGRNWAKEITNPTWNLTAISVPNNSYSWIVGADGILLVHDGKNWFQLPSGVRQNHSLRSVAIAGLSGSTEIWAVEYTFPSAHSYIWHYTC